MEKEPNYKIYFYFTLIILAGFNLWLWRAVFFSSGDIKPAVYFFNVGQGDSQLIALPPVNILIDGGRGKRVLGELDKVFSEFNGKYIDLVIATHADIDHFGGLREVVKNYQVGAFLFNGKASNNSAYLELVSLVNRAGIPIINLAAKDKIKYNNDYLAVLSPEAKEIFYNDDNNSSLVLMLNAGGEKALFTGDISLKTEDKLASRYDLTADILKVSHHGSKNSSGANFLNDVLPRISVIGVGRNSYGHPHPLTIERLQKAGSKIFRTDTDGAIKIVLD